MRRTYITHHEYHYGIRVQPESYPLRSGRIVYSVLSIALVCHGALLTL